MSLNSFKGFVFQIYDAMQPWQGSSLKDKGNRFVWSSTEDNFISSIFQENRFFVLWPYTQNKKSLKVFNMKKQLIISSWFFI